MWSVALGTKQVWDQIALKSGQLSLIMAAFSVCCVVYRVQCEVSRIQFEVCSEKNILQNKFSYKCLVNTIGSGKNSNTKNRRSKIGCPYLTDLVYLGMFFKHRCE